MNHEPSRREFIGATGALAAGWLGADPGAVRKALLAARHAVLTGTVTFDVLTAEQAADVEAIASQIIPTDDLPGAREARVVVYIDRALGSFQASMLDQLIDGLADLEKRGGGVRFATLPSERHGALLHEIEDTPFFRSFRNEVLVGMFAHPSWGGNYGGAGWQVLGFDPRFLWAPPFGDYDAEVIAR